MASTERRTLKMHPRLLWDVIHRQAGTLPKAILEGVMNSVDAGATRCDVKIDRNTFSISDDGKGFKDEDEIHRFFETFGYPHKEGDAKYGRFRMGRGQMFSFGKNRWSTNTFRMDVDLKPQQNELGEEYALGYEFSRGKNVDGCNIKVELYDVLKPSDLDTAIREIQDFVKFVHIPVTLNGKVISTDPTKEKWDVETESAYIKKRASGSLDVYNQGVLVEKIPSYRYGTGGIVVSKTALDVNFARNQVQNTCKVFKKVVSFLQDEALKAVKRAPLNDDQRENIAQRLASGEVKLIDVEEARIVTDVTGSHHKFDVFKNLSRFQNRISIAPRGDRVAEMAHTRKMGFVITPETAGRFGVSTPKEFVTAIQKIALENNSYMPRITPTERDEFLSVISAHHEPLQDKELNAAEKLAMRAIREGYKTMISLGRYYDWQHGGSVFSRAGQTSHRRISAGVSDTAQGWTDGTTEIWINRKLLKQVKEGIPGMTKLAGLLLHEMLHEGPSTGTHDHGVEFYERFHDLALDSDILSKTATAMLRTCLKELRDENKATTLTFTRSEDLEAEAATFGIGTDPEQEQELPEVPPAPVVEDAPPAPSASENGNVIPVAATKPKTRARPRSENQHEMDLGPVPEQMAARM